MDAHGAQDGLCVRLPFILALEESLGSQTKGGPRKRYRDAPRRTDPVSMECGDAALPPTDFVLKAQLTQRSGTDLPLMGMRGWDLRAACPIGRIRPDACLLEQSGTLKSRRGFGIHQPANSE
jgi:hypothetical protein